MISRPVILLSVQNLSVTSRVNRVCHETLCTASGCTSTGRRYDGARETLLEPRRFIGVVSGALGVVAGAQSLILASAHDDSSQCPLRAGGTHTREEVRLAVGTDGVAWSGLCDSKPEPGDASQAGLPQMIGT